jgi:hypothetical protein
MFSPFFSTLQTSFDNLSCSQLPPLKSASFSNIFEVINRRDNLEFSRNFGSLFTSSYFPNSRDNLFDRAITRVCFAIRLSISESLLVGLLLKAKSVAQRSWLTAESVILNITIRPRDKQLR